MKAYTFEAIAAITIHADSEEEARTELRKCCVDEDVEIGPGGVYLPSHGLDAAKLTDVGEDDGYSDEDIPGDDEE